MSPEIKADWLRRLSSGDYVPARERLYTGSTEDGKKQMCCLGVLCDILVEKHPKVFSWRKSFSTSDPTTQYMILVYAVGVPDSEYSSTAYLPTVNVPADFSISDQLQLAFARLNDHEIRTAILSGRSATYEPVIAAIKERHDDL
jgi:hypothetical protein